MQHKEISPSITERARNFWQRAETDYDITIIGGGIQGAMTFNLLSEQGHKVLLVDQGDFASGTSQGSALSLWGGLLYLRQGELKEVFKLCKAREELKIKHPSWISSQDFRYVYGNEGDSRSEWLMKFGLWLYWLISSGKQTPPHRDSFADHKYFLNEVRSSFIYQEAQLKTSDARFVLDLILSGVSSHSLALNYTMMDSGNYDHGKKKWLLDLTHAQTGVKAQVRSTWIVNTAGIWADDVNDSLSLSTPYMHLRSKGVSLSFKRPPSHKDTLIFDTSSPAEEGMSLVPWGPVSVWGSTETLVERDVNGFAPSHEDIDFLLKTLNNHLASPITRADIISVRTGVRPIPIKKGKEFSEDPLLLSKKFIIHHDAPHQALSVYGGKITSALLIAESIKIFLNKAFPLPAKIPELSPQNPETIKAFGYSVTSPQWSKEHECASSLHDYLRRRTNISQWIPRGGFGKNNEHETTLKELSVLFHGGDENLATIELEKYKIQIETDYETLKD